MSYSDHIDKMDSAVRDHLGGVSVIYTPSVGSPVTVQGMFDSNYVLSSDNDLGLSHYGRAVFLKLAELPTDPREDEPTLTIGGVDYTIRERITDGIEGGGIMLALFEAP